MRKRVLIFLTVIFLLAGGTAWAAQCPSFGELGNVRKAGEFRPTRAAVAPSGLLYATDSLYGKLYVLDPATGKTLNSKAVESPLGIAVGSDGTVYVGMAKGARGFYTGEVAVYGPDLDYLGSLGSGVGEFQYPLSIQISSGRIYVVDNRANAVKIYDEVSRAHLFNLKGGSGLYHPTGVAVDATGNIYVSDRKLQYGCFGSTCEWGPGAGLHKYGPDGSFISSFAVTFSYAGTLGAMAVPSGITIDSQDRIYVSDSGMGKIHVFDTSGTAVCLIDPYESDAGISGINIGPNGAMVASIKEAIAIYETEDYVSLGVSPDAVEVVTQECANADGSATVTLSNAGSGTLAWAASADQSWITLSAPAGELSGRTGADLGITVDTAGMAAGDARTGTVTVASNGGTVTVAVTASAFGAPVLEVVQGDYGFTVRGSDVPTAHTLSIKLVGDRTGTMAWAATADSAWINITPGKGASDTLSLADIGVNGSATSALAGGSYSGLVTVGAGCAAIAPVTVPVSMNLIKGGTIVVKANLAEATYTVSGPGGTFTGSGASSVFDGVAPGSYTIKYDASAAGILSPRSDSDTVSLGETTVFSGAFTDLREDNEILVTAVDPRTSAGDLVRTFDETGAFLDEIVLGATGAAVVTATGDVDGDGADDVVVGYASGEMAVFSASGAQIGAAFKAFEYEGALDLATGDVDGDGSAEIIVGAYGNSKQAEVRVFKYLAGTVYDTGVYFIAYQKKKGVNVATGDVDGDGLAEIITTRGGDGLDVVEVRIWNVVVGALGSWGVADAGWFEAGTSTGGADVTAGDLNADGVDEIIIAANAGKGSEIRSYSAGGSVFAAPIAVGRESASVASGDMDSDGSAEIVVGSSASSGGSIVRVYGANGSLKAEFKAFAGIDARGARVSLGQTVGQ